MDMVNSLGMRILEAACEYRRRVDDVRKLEEDERRSMADHVQAKNLLYTARNELGKADAALTAVLEGPA